MRILIASDLPLPSHAESEAALKAPNSNDHCTRYHRSQVPLPPGSGSIGRGVKSPTPWATMLEVSLRMLAQPGGCVQVL